MPARIPVEFLPIGERTVATVGIALHLRKGPGRLSDSALIDTGSHRTIFPEELLRVNRFLTAGASEDKDGVMGLGGHERLFFLGPAILAMVDDAGDSHFINVPRVQFTRVRMPPILGTDVLRMVNARLFIDFNQENGHIELG